MTNLIDADKVQNIIDKIETHWPDWIDWFVSLTLNQKEQLKRRISKEGDYFIKETMWGFAEYAAFRTANLYKRKLEEEKLPHLTPEEIAYINVPLKLKYKMNIVESKPLTK